MIQGVLCLFLAGRKAMNFLLLSLLSGCAPGKGLSTDVFVDDTISPEPTNVAEPSDSTSTEPESAADTAETNQPSQEPSQEPTRTNENHKKTTLS